MTGSIPVSLVKVLCQKLQILDPIPPAFCRTQSQTYVEWVNSDEMELYIYFDEAFGKILNYQLKFKQESTLPEVN